MLQEATELDLDLAVPVDFERLFHRCTGPTSTCEFCNFRKMNPIDLGWEALFEDDPELPTIVSGLQLTASQLDDPTKELSTQQTTDFLYLTPLRRPKPNVWYSAIPLGHNVLSKVVYNLMKDGGYDGHYTNHSLRVSSACSSR